MEVQKALSQEMALASHSQKYEQAAALRDQIQALTTLQRQQTINAATLQDADVFAIAQEGVLVCIQVFFYRAGHHYGSAALFPERLETTNLTSDFTTFLALFYEDKDPPPEIFVNLDPADKESLVAALSQKAQKSVKLICPQKGEKKLIIDRALENAREALFRKQSHKTTQKSHLKELANVCDLPNSIERVEVYDNSHIQGRYNVGAMIVATSDGFDKKSYRKFKIRSEKAAGDDYAMMREVMTRRFTGTLAAKAEQNPLPELVILDGGAGQLSVVQKTFDALGIQIPLLAVAKGPDRNAGREEFYSPEKKAFTLEEHQSLLHFIQRLRDEAHRFAIGTHREQRAKSMTASILNEIPGVGKTRKKALLQHFGSAKAIEAAGIQDLQAVQGISSTLAEQIYHFFHTS